jgi:hypothetical protein
MTEQFLCKQRGGFSCVTPCSSVPLLWLTVCCLQWKWFDLVLEIIIIVIIVIIIIIIIIIIMVRLG